MMRQLRLACSNLAWPNDAEAAALSTLVDLGYTGIEVAPTKVWPDLGKIGPKNAAAYRHYLEDMGFSVPSMQAIYFGLDGVSLFKPDTYPELIERTFKVSILAEALGCPVLVFGAPRMRDPGTMEEAAVLDQAARILTKLAEIAHGCGTTLCIEPNAREYGCGFVWTVKQAAEIVRQIAHPGFGLHVDSAAMFMEDEDGPATIHENASLIRHFHVSEPKLCGLVNPKVNHQANLAALFDAGYSGWVSLESTEIAAFENSVSTLSSWIKRC